MNDYMKHVDRLITDRDSDSYRLEQHRKLHNLGLPRHPDAVNARQKEASFLVAQAVSEVDRIIDTQVTGYSDLDTNIRRNRHDRRPFTLKDAKPHAKYAAKLLREAWEMLDPSMGKPPEIHKDHALRTRLVEMGWTPPRKSIELPQCPTVAWMHPVADLVSTDATAYTNLSTGKPRELILKGDVMDHIEWLEMGIDEWRTYAIEVGKKLKEARDEVARLTATKGQV